MTQHSGETGDGLAAARTALAAGDSALGDADRALAGVLDDTFRLAIASIRRIEAVQSEIDALADSPELETLTSARLLLHRHRELIDTVTAARDHAATKSIELQRLSADYSGRLR